MVRPAEFQAEPGSFRDPSGRVFYWRERVYRSIGRAAAPHYEFLRDSGLLKRLQDSGRLLPCAESAVPASFAELLPPDTVLLLEHPRIPFISYPYEWTFRSLQRAALLHLDLHLELLEHGATLSDATAYNVQFNGPDPVFIDLLSIRRYRDGEFWLGHRQFCEQFLNPLLLRAWTGVPFNEWYRGRLEGLPTDALSNLLPWWRKLNPRTLVHVTLQAAGQRRATQKQVSADGRRLPRQAYASMLHGLRDWITALRPPDSSTSTWGDYAESNSYDAAQTREKHDAVRAFVTKAKPRLMYDIGCNTGEFARTALAAGARLVVGLDADHGALDRAATAVESDRLAFIPLWMDLANPSPAQGWAQSERMGLGSRAPADATVALALVHHLAIGRNVPLAQVAEWLLSLAPRLMVEFVPKSDPMVQLMLRNREDIFPGYDLKNFRRELGRVGRIVSQTPVGNRDRFLLEVERLAVDGAD